MSKTSLRATRIAMGMSAVLRDLKPLKLDPFEADEPEMQFPGSVYWHQRRERERRLPTLATAPQTYR